MRRRGLLALSALCVLSAVVFAVVSVLVSDESGGATTQTQSQSGFVSLESNGAGATAVLSGALTRKSFETESVRVVGSRLAGRSSDPDQFRATVLDSDGDEIETVRMWSPLLRLEWDRKGSRHGETFLKRAQVHISVPVSNSAARVVLGWPGGREVAQVEIGREVRSFCARASDNPAC